MPSNTYLPTLSQAQKQTFENNFYKLKIQQTSQLTGSGAVMFVSPEGKTHHVSRMGNLELTKVNTRNPLKQFSEYNVDNRQFSKSRFTKTVRLDSKDDINELIKDPTSDIYSILLAASKRTEDREIILGATGAVLVGAPNAAPTSISAATDGVLTISATGGVAYSTIQKVTQNFINNGVPVDMFRGSQICLTGKENSDLMAVTQFINNDYIKGDIVNQGISNRAGMYGVQVFAGSEQGGITVPNPILVEGVSTRSCVVMAPNAVAVSYKLNSLRIDQAAECVDSYDITIDMWMGVMRLEGALVQIITTTM